MYSHIEYFLAPRSLQNGDSRGLWSPRTGHIRHLHTQIQHERGAEGSQGVVVAPKKRTCCKTWVIPRCEFMERLTRRRLDVCPRAAATRQQQRVRGRRYHEIAGKSAQTTLLVRIEELEGEPLRNLKRLRTRLVAARRFGGIHGRRDGETFHFVSISMASKPLTCQCPTYDLDTIFWQTIFNNEDFCKQSFRVALIVRGIPSVHRQLQ